MKKVLNFVKGKKDDKGPSKINPQISVEITNPSGQKITSDDEHIMGLQQGFGYSIDVNGKDKSMLKIHKASWFGNLDKLKLCAKKTDINTQDALSRSCLHLAVAQGHTEVAWYLLNNNASTTVCDSDGLTPFLKAVECGQKDCTNLLIECGVDVNATDGDGNTGLHIASRSGFYNIASLLLKEGANLNVPNNSGNYPLHMATSCDHRDIVELLIRFGANVQVLDRERRTSLMLAARNGLSSIIKVLLENGALLETADSNGWTAEDYAQFGGHQDLMELLETKKKEASLDQSDKLSVQSSDQSEHVAFEVVKSSSAGNEETVDSPRSCVIPPALEPPRSWDLIQSGVMDQEGSLENRKSLLTLGNLKKGYNELGSCELIVSPADLAPSSLSPSGDIPAEMRLSPEPLSLAPTPERRTRSPLERGNSFDLPSDNDSPLQGFSAEELNSAGKQTNDTQLLSDNDNLDTSKINNNILKDVRDLEKSATVIANQSAFAEACVNRYNDKNLLNDVDKSIDKSGELLVGNLAREDNTCSMECSVSYDDLDERSYCTENQLSGVSSSLDKIDYPEGKSLSIQIIQSTGNLDDTLSITTTKNIFRECHSLELLEAEVGDSRSYKNSKRHHRNKSITLSGQPQLWKSVGTLPKTHTFDRGSIDAQLMCYDEALRQLANVKKTGESKDAQSNTSPERADLKLIKCSKSLDQFETKSGGSSPESFRGRSGDFQIPTDDELEYLDRDNSFPPPPMHFLENEDSELCHLDCDDKSIQIDVLPMPISMLTPIKETQIECDSLSVAETFDNEHSLSERSNIRSDGTPNHFNVEVIVNSKTSEASQSSLDEAVVPQGSATNEASLQLVDDVFIEDPTLAESYERYFVDLKALEMVPSAVDFNKIVFPADSPSPQKAVKTGSSNKPSTMRATGVGGSKDTDNDIDEDDIDEEDGDSDEDDPPFWQNTDKGGYFLRQDTIVAKESDANFFPRSDLEAVATTSSGKLMVRRSCGSPLQNSEAETASASDTPRLSPMGAKEASHLCEATLANGLLEEKAAALMNNTERLKYELEDARQAEAVRVDTISILQSQLSRLEAQYAEAQEEVCTLKQKADCAELELKHLRELCACLSRDRNERPQGSVKQLVDQATASTPTEDDFRQIHMQIMIKHLEDSKKLEEEKNHQLVRHLEEVLMTNQNMISEKEALIAQNIADVRKLQEDTLCWKDRYEELAAKLELLDKRLDPRLIEAQDTIDTLKRTIAILQQEKGHSKRRASRYQKPCSKSVTSESLLCLGYDEECIKDILNILKLNYGNPRNVRSFNMRNEESDCSDLSDNPSDDDPTRRTQSYSTNKANMSSSREEIDKIQEIVTSSYPSAVSERVDTSSSEHTDDVDVHNLPAQPSSAEKGKRAYGSRGKLEESDNGRQKSNSGVDDSGKKENFSGMDQNSIEQIAVSKDQMKLATVDKNHMDIYPVTHRFTSDQSRIRLAIEDLDDAELQHDLCRSVSVSAETLRKLSKAIIEGNAKAEQKTRAGGEAVIEPEISSPSRTKNKPSISSSGIDPYFFRSKSKSVTIANEVMMLSAKNSEASGEETCGEVADVRGKTSGDVANKTDTSEDQPGHETKQETVKDRRVSKGSDSITGRKPSIISKDTDGGSRGNPSPRRLEEEKRENYYGRRRGSRDQDDRRDDRTSNREKVKDRRSSQAHSSLTGFSSAKPLDGEGSEEKRGKYDERRRKSRDQDVQVDDRNGHRDEVKDRTSSGTHPSLTGSTDDGMNVVEIRRVSASKEFVETDQRQKSAPSEGLIEGEKVVSATASKTDQTSEDTEDLAMKTSPQVEDGSKRRRISSKASDKSTVVNEGGKLDLDEEKVVPIVVSRNSNLDSLPEGSQVGPSEPDSKISSKAIDGTESGLLRPVYSNKSEPLSKINGERTTSGLALATGLENEKVENKQGSDVEQGSRITSGTSVNVSSDKSGTLEQKRPSIDQSSKIDHKSEADGQIITPPAGTSDQNVRRRRRSEKPSSETNLPENQPQQIKISSELGSTDLYKVVSLSYNVPVQVAPSTLTEAEQVELALSEHVKFSQNQDTYSYSASQADERINIPKLEPGKTEKERAFSVLPTIEEEGKEEEGKAEEGKEEDQIHGTKPLLLGSIDVPPLRARESPLRQKRKPMLPRYSKVSSLGSKRSSTSRSTFHSDSSHSESGNLVGSADSLFPESSLFPHSDNLIVVDPQTIQNISNPASLNDNTSPPAIAICDCRAKCNCCTCGEKKQQSPPAVPPPDDSNRPPSREYFDYSTPPFPKDSFKVLNSPFFAHWSYYDIDRDHPVAQFMKRSDPAEFDTSSDCIIMRDYRIGEYCIPFANITTHRKKNSKLVCNYYKTRSLTSKKKGAVTFNEVQQGDSSVIVTDGDMSKQLLSPEVDGGKLRKCTCKKKLDPDENLWSGYEEESEAIYVPLEVRQNEMNDEQPATAQEEPIKTGVGPRQDLCDRGVDCQCTSTGKVMPSGPTFIPTTPCQSCDCFISDLASASSHSRSGDEPVVSLEESEDSSKQACFREYFGTLQELTIQLYGMISQMKEIIGETPSGSTLERYVSSHLLHKESGSLKSPTSGQHL